MIIANINLDDFDKHEYLAFIGMIIDYYYVQFNEILTIKNESEMK